MMRPLEAATVIHFPTLCRISLVGAALVLGCQPVSHESPGGSATRAITAGSEVAKGELRPVGGILTNAGTVCTGTLITPTVVLTAAHCVEPDLIKQAIRTGGGEAPDELSYFFSFERELDPSDTSAALAVDEVVWHEDFLGDILGLFERPGRWNDIALMYLAEPVTDHPLQRIASTAVVEALEMSRTHLVAGYGLTDDTDPTSAGTLTKGISHLDERGESELIAGTDDEQQACRGDSGGPIFADDDETFQIGIASRINADLYPPPSEPPPCETGLLYTRVDVYSDWLADKVPELGDINDDGSDSGDDGDSDDGGCRATGGVGGHGFLLLAFVAISLSRRRVRPRLRS